MVIKKSLLKPFVIVLFLLIVIGGIISWGVMTPKYSFAKEQQRSQIVFIVGETPNSEVKAIPNRCIQIKPGCESAFEKKYAAKDYFDPILDTITPEEQQCLFDGCLKTQLDAFDELISESQRVRLTGSHLSQIAKVYVDTNGLAENLVLWIDSGYIYGMADNKAYGFPGKITVKAQLDGTDFNVIEVYYGQLA